MGRVVMRTLVIAGLAAVTMPSTGSQAGQRGNSNIYGAEVQKSDDVTGVKEDSSAERRLNYFNDGDGDGVVGSADDCPNTIPGVPVDGNGCPPSSPGDIDDDGDADFDDFAEMQACISGPAVPGDDTPICQKSDLNLDSGVDLKDVDAFQRCFSGPNLPANPHCTQHSARIVAGCLRINGTAASSQLALRLQPGAPAVLQVDVGDDGTADFSFDRALFDCIVVNSGGGGDSVRIDEVNGIFTTEELTTIDGGSGDDKLFGGSGGEIFIGGPGDDFVDGNRGIDEAFLGAGDDAFQWDPGDGSDIVEGQSGMDILLFVGAGIDESFDLSANGERFLLFRTQGSITMDCDGVEQIDLPVLGGADSVVVNSLVGTDVVEVNIDLAGIPEGGTGDAESDIVTIEATDGVDNVSVSGSGTNASIRGLSAFVRITAAEIANDHLKVNALAGDDTLLATGLAFGVFNALVLDGGSGDDVLTGGDGADLLTGDVGADLLDGGDGNDTVVGGDGDDVVQLGAGNDRFVWNPGDDTDLVDGDDGVDTVVVNGGNGDENFTVAAVGTRVRFDRTSINPAPFSLDIGTSEHLILNANGGADTLRCSGDLAALIRITADGGSGDDNLFGGNGSDLLLGGDDDDFIDGNQGIDLAVLGSGDDVFQWDPGDGSDIVEGQAGHDILVFNGAAINETFDLSADGGRLLFSRNPGSITMNCDDLEQVDLPVLEGADTVAVRSLAGTDVVDVNISLTAGDRVTGDAQADNVIVDGTENPDTIEISPDSGAVVVAGLSALVRIVGAESRADLLVVNGLGGADTITPEPGVDDLIILQIVNE